MIRVKGLITSLKATLLTNRNAFPHKVEEAWDKDFNEANPKLNYLQKLLESNSIRPYFIEKDITQLEKEDIYFYLENKQLFHRLPKTSLQELIRNPNASVMLKFHLAQQLNAFRNGEIRACLLDSFNETLNSKGLVLGDLLFCLDILCEEFNLNKGAEELNVYQLERTLLSIEESKTFLSLLHYFYHLRITPELVQKSLMTQHVTNLTELTVQNVLLAKDIISFYELTVSAEVQERFRNCFLGKRKQFTAEEGEGIVNLLNYYPQSANLVNIDCLNVDSYISYLRFFVDALESPLIPKVIQHPLPRLLVQNCQVSQFSEIVQLRIKLGLDTQESLVGSVKNIYTKQLNCLTALLRYLEKNEKLTVELEAALQKSFLNMVLKLGLPQVFETYGIVDVFKVLGYLSVNNIGTINFWKKCLRFVTEAIQTPDNYRNLSGEEQKKFVVYLFQIFKNKPFPRELEDQIINLTLLSLTINKWSIREILPLTISLKVNKIADNELWFGIEQRIKQMNVRHLESQRDKKALRKIIYNFTIIGKGSFEFWNEMNKCLGRKEKQEILAHFKVPNTLAHNYLRL